MTLVDGAATARTQARIRPALQAYEPAPDGNQSRPQTPPDTAGSLTAP